MVINGSEIIAQRKCEFDKSQQTTSSKTANKKDLIEWQEIKLKGVSICLPKEFELKKVQGIDLSYDGYKDDDIELKIYTSKQAPIPIIYSKSTFKTESKYINGIYTWIWQNVEEDNDYKYVKGARFFIENKIDGEVIVIYVATNAVTKKDYMEELADKIFSSIKVKSK